MKPSRSKRFDIIEFVLMAVLAGNIIFLIYLLVTVLG